MQPFEVSPELADDYRLYECANHTELYQIARDVGFVVPPKLTREDLIRIIIHDQPPPAIDEHPIDEWRWAIMHFIIDHRKRLADWRLRSAADPSFPRVDSPRRFGGVAAWQADQLLEAEFRTAMSGCGRPRRVMEGVGADG